MTYINQKNPLACRYRLGAWKILGLTGFDACATGIALVSVYGYEKISRAVDISVVS